jgi:hypothetical protein
LIEWLAGDHEAAKSRLDDVAGLAYLGDLPADDAALIQEVQRGLAAGKQ